MKVLRQASRIRELAALNWEIEAIAAKVGLGPSKVRRVLGRSDQRGAPRKRVSSAVLSCGTTEAVASQVRAMAKGRGVPVSEMLDELLRKGIATEPANGARPPTSSAKGPQGEPGGILLAADLELDRRAATQKFGIIARSEAGKTYLAGKLVEGLHAIGCQVIVFDPVGNWWGLTLAANGTDPGLPFVVFGGERGHLPLTADSGRRIARLIIDRNLSAVLDLTGLRKRRQPGRGGEPESELQRFVADFEEEVLEASLAQPKPRMAIYDEAHKMLPQVLKDGGNRMLDAGEDLVRTGRNYGWGCVLMSQRPQSINKEVLSQVECFFVGQLTEAPARDRLKEWIVEKHANVKGELDELAQLQRGEFFCWSPQWLQTFRRIRVLPKVTFDASRTPELGALAVPANVRQSSISPVELEAIRELLAQGDPKEPERRSAVREDPDARGRLQVAEAELARLRAQVAERDVRLERTKADLLMLCDRLGIEDAAEAVRASNAPAAGAPPPVVAAQQGRRRPPPVPPGAPMEAGRAKEAAGHRRSGGRLSSATVAPDGRRTDRSLSPHGVQGKRQGVGGRSTPDPRGRLGKCARALLAALVQHGDLSLHQAAIVARYAGSAPIVSKAAGELRTAGLITGSSARLAATSAARRHPELQDLEPLPVGRALAEWWLAKLGKCASGLLQQVLRAHPRAISLERACAGAGYEPGRPIVAKSVGQLRTLMLLEGANGGLIVNARLVD